jgi:hypothetical protein
MSWISTTAPALGHSERRPAYGVQTLVGRSHIAMTDGYFEIGGDVEFGAFARGLYAALRRIRMMTSIAVEPEAMDEDAVRIALHQAWKEGRACRFLIRGLRDARPFDDLEPVFFACHDAGAHCRVIVGGPHGRQAAYSRAGGSMLWIAFLLTSTGEVRYGPTSTHQSLREGDVPSVSDWLDAAQALSEELPPLIRASRS